MGIYAKLRPPQNIKIDFRPSERQYELWKLLQPDYCPKCGGHITQKLIGYDVKKNPQYKPVCESCGNTNLPQMILGGGAAGGGKSFLGACWLIISCMRFENIRAVVARKTIKSLKESTWNTIKTVLKNWGLKEEVNYRINNLEGTLTFWNDSVIIMKEMVDLPSDPNFERFGSSEYTIAMIDEVSEISEKAVEVLFSRLRWRIHETFKTSRMFMSTNYREKHIGGVDVTGDPAGLQRSTTNEDGTNNYTIITETLGKGVLKPKIKLLKKQPPQVTRCEFVNEVFEGFDGWKLMIDLRCRKLTEDLIYQLKNEDGTKCKAKVTDAKTGVKYEKYGHLSDCLDYLLCYYLRDSWTKYKRGDGSMTILSTATINEGFNY